MDRYDYHMMKRLLVFAALTVLSPLAAVADDPFAITGAFTGRAVVSCGDLTHSDGTIDSAGVASPGPTNKGHVASNGNIKMSGGALVDGDATAGPGKTVSNSGSSRVTGTKSSAAAAFDCKPVDLAALATSLQASNDNSKIPLTGQGKNPLTGGAHTDFSMSGGDTITLAAGTYYFTKFTLSGGSTLKIAGPVRILCTGDVSISGGSVNNAATGAVYTPYRLRFWTSGSKFTLSSATMAGFIYVPSGTYTNSAAHLIGGAFANSVTVSGNSHVTRAIDDVLPSVAINAPSEGAIVPDAAHVEVRGTVAETETAVTLQVNGQPVALAADGTFQTTVNLTGASPATITATATDAAGNIGTAHVTVTTTPPPTLSLTSPAPGSYVNKRIVDLTGGSGTATAVTVNGQSASIANGVWTATGFDLGADGPHTLTIVGTNVGGSSTINPVVTSDTVAPSVEATTLPPPNAAGWNQTDVTVHFTCSDLGSGIASCPGDVVVTSEGANQAVTRSATDRAGNSALATAVVSIDKTVPAVTITAPSNNALSSDPHVVVTGGADDAATVTVNGVVATIDPEAHTFTSRVDLLEGNNVISVVGIDLAGNIGTASVSTNLDTRAPQVLIALPAADACVDTAALEVTGSASDPNVASVKVSIGATTVTVTPTGGAFTATIAVPEEGKKLITVEATDSLGHTTSASRAVTIDRTAPAIEIAEGGAPFAKATVNRAIALFVRAVDADPNVVVVAKLDGAPYASGKSIATEGNHTLLVTATDCATHTSTKSADFAVDLTPPAIRNLNPANGATVGTMPSSISGSTDTDAVSVEIAGTQFRATPAADGTFTLGSVPFGEGSNRFTLVATDRAGNSSSLDYTVKVKTAAPVVEIRESGLPIPEGALFNRTVTPVVRSNDPSATVTATLDGAPFTSGTTITTDGAHKLTGTATDALSHSGTAEVNFTIDRTPPVVKITAPLAGTIRSDQVEVRGTAGDAVAASVNGQPVTLAADGTFVLGSLLLEFGDNSIVATGRDRAGNSGRDEVIVTRDDAGAAVLITYPPDRSLTNRASTDVVGRILTLGRGATVALGTTPLSLDPTGEFRVSGYTLTEGENTITVTATATNGVKTSATTHVTADFTPPSLTLLESGQPLVDGARFAAQAVISLQFADAGGGAVTTTLTIDGTKTTTVPFTITTAGGHSIIAVARDLAGNETRAERTLFIGTSGGGSADCKLDSFDPTNGAVVLSSTTTLVGRSGGALGVKVNGVAATVADGAFWATVELPNEGPNTVTIACTDAAGTPAGTPVTITLQRVTGNPSIALSTPDENFASAQETIAVTGTVGPGVVTADVNGVAATITGSDTTATRPFTVSAVRLAPGLNLIVAHGRNAAGRVATASRRGYYLKDAPSISISAPSSSATTGTPKITVSGTYANLDPATIVVTNLVTSGTTPATFVRFGDTTGSFAAADVPLVSGPQTLRVAGRDRLNREASATVVVTLSTGAPSIAIAQPADHAYFTGATTFSVSGTFQAAAGSTVDVNGVAATLTGSTYTATATFSTLAGGFTPVVARVTQPDGLSASASMIVTLVSAAPTVVESFPAPNAVEVDNGALLLVLFSQSMDIAAVTGAFRLEDASGTPVSGTLHLDKDVLTFAPATLLANGGRYTMRVSTAAKNLAGLPLAAEYTSAFTVAGSAPSTAPSVNPISSAVCGQSITVTGTATPGARVRLESGSLILNAAADATGKFTFTYPISGQSGFALVRVRTVGSDGSVSPAAELKVRIDCSGPQVLNAAFDRAANKFTIQFSEPIDAATATVGTGNAILLALEDGRSVAGSASVANNLVTVTPAEDLSAKTVSLTVNTAIKDTIGNPLVSAFSQTFAVTGDQPVAGDGSGFISGEVYDATTGRPLSGASIVIEVPSKPPVATATDARGRYVARLPEGAHTIKASLSGYTSVWREIIVPAGAGVVPIDIRLTRRGDPATSTGAAIALTNGGDTTVTRKADLSVPAGALTSGAKIALTAVGAQALTGLLPLGWSPIASAEIAIDGSDAAVALAGAQLTFNITAAEVTAATQNLSAARYDAQRDEWRVLVAVANVGSDGRVVVPVTSSGAYALVYPDKATGLTAPPLPVAGDVLRGVPAAAPNAPALAKRDFILDPPVILPTGRAVARLRIEGGVPSTFPSGTAVQAYIDEELRLADGSRLLDPPFATDLLLYRTLAGDLGVADFHLAPSTRAAQVVLEVGVDHIRIQPYPGRLDRGTIIGSEGGRVPADDKVAIDVPSGAVPEPLRATATSMTSGDLTALGAVAGFRVVGGFQLTLQRVTEPAPVDLDGDGKADPVAAVELFVPARATFTVDASKLPAPSSQVILAELLDQTPYGRMLHLAVPMAPVDPSQTSTPAIRFATKSIDRSLLPVDGVVHEGRYVLLAAEAPIAFATGTVHALSATGRLLSDARVLAPPLGVAELSRTAGIYNIPVPAAPGAPFTLVPRHITTGDGAAYVHPSAPAADAVVRVDLALVPQPPVLTSVVVLKGDPPTQGTLVPGTVTADIALTTNVRASFAPGIDPASITADSITVADASTGAKVSGSAAADGTVAVVWTLTAGQQLKPNGRYVITVSANIRGSNGALVAHGATFSVATVKQILNTEVHRERIRITMPDANGVSRISGDPGALPAGWQAVAVRRKNDFLVRYQTTAANDGSFTFFIGNGGDASDKITIADLIDLRVVSNIGNLAAIFALTPFVSEDGKAFVVPAGEAVRYTTPEGITLDVPAGAFDVPTIVTVAAAKKEDFLDVPSLEAENEYAGSVKVDFDGVANKPLAVQLPVPAGFDTAGKQFILAEKGQSVRGPRLAVIDLMRVEGGKFTNEPDPNRSLTVYNSKVRANQTLVGSQASKYLRMLLRSGIFMVLDIKVPVGGAVGWAAMEGLQANYDLMWDIFASYYIPHQAIAERGGALLPIVTGKRFTVVGVDAGTGLQAFSRTYDPIPNGEPGTVVGIEPAQQNDGGPYPTFTTPARIELIDLDVEDIDLRGVRNFIVHLSTGGSVKVTSELGEETRVEVLNVTNGMMASGTGAAPITLSAKVGDRLALLIEQYDVDPSIPISVAFNEPVWTGGSTDPDEVDAFLHNLLKVEQAPEPLEGQQPNFSDVTAQARFSTDSGARRINFQLLSALQRQAVYRVTLQPGIADVFKNTPGLKLGQGTVESNGQLVPVGGGSPMHLIFHVREPAGALASFTATTGGLIRGMDLAGNVLLVAALDGGLRSFDMSNPAAVVTPLGFLPGPPASGVSHLSVFVDRHNRVYSTASSPMAGMFRSYRVEDFLGGGSDIPIKGSSLINWKLGYSQMIALPSNTVISDIPESIPFRIKVVLQDDETNFKNREEFIAGANASKAGEYPDDLQRFTATISHDSSPYAVQRITIENLTLDMRWSADAAGGAAVIQNILARSGDKMRLIRNQKTFAIVAHTGYGVGIYDANAIESNRFLNLSSYSPNHLREKLVLTAGKIARECPNGTPDYGIVENWLSTDAELRGDESGTLYSYAPDPYRGILDLRLQIPSSDGGGTHDDDCDQRPSPNEGGLLFRSSPDGHSVPRIQALRSAFAGAAGRDPMNHFLQVGQYHWSIDGAQNKLPGVPGMGLRGTSGGESASRDYLLVAGFEYGLIVLDVHGEPAAVPAWPLGDANVADVIWIPGGAVSVRVYQNANIAVVGDRYGRAVLVDLSRIDERWDDKGAPTTGLFPTAKKALSGTATDPYGVGADDPRILWKSDPGMVLGAAAPVFDTETGMIYAASGARVTTISAVDPRLRVRVNLGDESGLSDVGGIVPLGIAPPKNVQDRINGLPSCGLGGTTQCRDNASLGAFRLEVALPGNMVDSLTNSEGELQLAVESERVTGAISEQTPSGFPRSHLRRTRRDGSAESGDRAASGFKFKRIVPDELKGALRNQRGYNRFVSPWIVAIADPRASIKYDWNGATAQQKKDAGCESCDRPKSLENKTENDDVWELWTNGRFVAVRPELKNATQTIFAGTQYAYLGRQARLIGRFATVMADTVRPTEALVAAQNAPVAVGALQHTLFLHSGEMEASTIDLDAGGRAGFNVRYERTYRSRTIGGGVFGQGWDSSLLRRLRALPNGEVEYRDGVEVWRFRAAADGGYQSPKGLFLKLSRTQRGWKLTDQGWRITEFDDLGRMIAISDEFFDPQTPGSGNVIRFVYDQAGRLSAILDPVQRPSFFDYWIESDAAAPGAYPGMVKQLTDWRGRQINYEYDVNSGTLMKVKLPDVANTTGSRPEVRYGYMPAAGSYNDQLELRSNLITVTDPQEAAAGGAARVTFTYQPGTGFMRDRAIAQQWGTGESATFTYSSPTSATVKDVLGQTRTYALTQQPKDYVSDRAHILTLLESGVTVSSTPFGQLPATLTAAQPATTSAERSFTFSYDAEGQLLSSALSGVRSVTYAYKNVQPEAPGFVPASVTTTPQGGPGESITKTFSYQSGANRSTFLSAISANGQKIDIPEASRATKQLNTNNNSIATTLAYETSGLLSSTASSGGTDPSGGGGGTSVQYAPSTDSAKHRRGKALEIDSSGLKTSIQYPTPDETVASAPREITTTTQLDTWERPVHVTVAGPGLNIDKRYEYDATGHLRKYIRNQGSAQVTTTYAYDVMGRPTSVTTDNVATVGTVTESTTYDLAGRRIVTNHAGGSVTTTTLDTLGRPISRETTTGGSPISDYFAYDLVGNLVLNTDLFQASAKAYDAHGRVVGYMDLDGTKATATSDAWGRPTSIKGVDAGGAPLGEATLGFTPAGRLQTMEMKIDGAQSRNMNYVWDGGGRMTGVSSSGRAEHSSFDSAGRLLTMELGAGSAAAVTERFGGSDISGHVGILPQTMNLKEKTGAYGLAVEYNAAANVVTQNLGSLEWKTSFDEAGNITSASLPNRAPYSFEWDSRGALKLVSMPGGASNNYTYHPTGALASYTDPANEVTSTSNDLIGRPIKRVYKDGTEEKIEWEGRRVKSVTDREGRIQTLVYNSRGQIGEITGVGGKQLEKIEYDDAGHVIRWSTPDALIEFSEFDFDGNPRKTAQSRLSNGTVIDKYTQDHTWDVHGARTAWTMPTYGGFQSTNAWTTAITLQRDAMGNLTKLQRTLAGSGGPTDLLSADYRNINRPDKRTITTAGGNSIVRDYGYDNTNGLLTRMAASVNGRIIAGSEVIYDGLQKAKAQVLGVSGGSRINEWSYDARSRLQSSLLARDAGSTPASDSLTTADFRTSLTRPALTPVDPPTVEFTEDPNGGHKLAVKRRGTLVEQFSFLGGERREDGHFFYEYDGQGRLAIATMKAAGALAFPRRVRYFYDGNDRLVGRREEYAPVANGLTPQSSDWKLEDRAEILGVEPLPADATFVWDPVDDHLVAIFKAGASANPNIDPNGGLVRQIIHGELQYDDPVEVATVDTNAPQGVSRLYPVYDEAGSKSLQVVLNQNAQIVARTITAGPFGEDQAVLAGPAVDRVSITAKKDAAGNVIAVDVVLRSTEAIAQTSVATGFRLAAVDSSGNVVRTSTTTATLAGDSTAHWSLSAADWNALVASGSGPLAISIAATSSGRGESWSASRGFLPAPQWATATRPVYASAALPVEVRESLGSLSQWIAAIPAGGEKTQTLYEVPSLYALGAPRMDNGVAVFTAGDPELLIVSAAFHAQPFADPLTGKNYVRARWFDPETGTWLTADPAGYADSSNLFAYAGADPVNHDDPTGKCWNPLNSQCYDDNVIYNTAGRVVAGVAGFVVMAAKTVGGLIELAVDSQLAQMGDVNAMMRQGERIMAIGQVLRHPIKTIVESHERAFDQIASEENSGHWFMASMHSAELASGDAVAVAGAVEGGIGLARMGARAMGTVAVAAETTTIVETTAILETAAATETGAIAEMTAAAARPVVQTGAAAEVAAAGSRSTSLMLRPIEIEFPARGLSAAERQAFASHLAEQEMALNELSLGSPAELEANLASYENIGKQVNGSRRMARKYLPGDGAGLDASHRLDTVAGGRLHDFAGFRSPVQQRIGSLWRVKRGLIVPGRVHRLVAVFLDE
jgi:RHS repeat-associated protein